MYRRRSTGDFIVVDTSPLTPRPTPQPPTPTQPSSEKVTAAPATPKPKKSQIKPDLLADGTKETPPKKKRGRPPKVRSATDGVLVAPAPKKRKTAKTEPFAFKGPPDYLLDPNRRDAFADPAMVKVEDDGTVRSMVGDYGPAKKSAKTAAQKAPSRKVPHDPKQSGSCSGIRENDDSLQRSPSPQAPKVRPNHRYLPVNPPKYGGADPRRYKNAVAGLPIPKRRRIRSPSPPRVVDRGANAPDGADPSLLDDPLFAPKNVHRPAIAAGRSAPASIVQGTQATVTDEEYESDAETPILDEYFRGG